MRAFTVFILFNVIFSCNNLTKQNDCKIDKKNESKIPLLEDTKWQFKIAEDCVNYYHFKADSNCVYYSCETEDKSYGKYFVKQDTLHIYEFVTDSDSLLTKEDIEHRSQQAKYKIVFESEKLKHIERWSYSGAKKKWTKDNFEFGDNFLFEKVR